jgi:hypothetical protein
MRGKFQGTIAPTTPCANDVKHGARTRRLRGEAAALGLEGAAYHWSPLAHFRVHELSPSGVVVNVANDSWNVCVARLANGFAVVQGLDAGDNAHVLLEVAGDGVKMTGTGVRRKLRPGTKRLSRRLNGIIAVVLRALDGFAQYFTGRRILRFIKPSALRLVPLVVDKVAERATVVVQPSADGFCVFRGWAVLQTGKLQNAAHGRFVGSFAGAHDGRRKLECAAHERLEIIHKLLCHAWP